MIRALKLSSAGLLVAGLLVAGLVALPPAAATPDRSAKKQRIAFDIKLPLESPTGSFQLFGMSPGPVEADSGTTTFTSGPAPVFIGRIVAGQLVDRFRATSKLTGRHGDLTICLRVDFVSAGNGYQVGTGVWSIVGGTGAYAGLTGGGRSALVRPPAPPGTDGFARHEGFVSK